MLWLRVGPGGQVLINEDIKVTARRIPMGGIEVGIDAPRGKYNIRREGLERNRPPEAEETDG